MFIDFFVLYPCPLEAPISNDVIVDTVASLDIAVFTDYF